MLTAHPDIAKVSFTGESGTGKVVMGDSAATLKQVTMELGGKSPMIIFDDAKLDDAVSAAMVANFYTKVRFVRTVLACSFMKVFMSLLLN